MSGIDYEKLGVFYLGKTVDEAGERSEELLLYDSKDLTTHALVVGMTGSGKTGLGIGMLEEAALDGIPALLIDPKGDLGNLLLTFPDLEPEDFRPWVDPAEATRAGKSVEELARWTADLWKGGLADWDQDGERIRRFRDATDLTIYTPGASTGVPLSVLESFDAPAEEVRTDADALRERVDGATAGLLALLGIDADPVQSRPYILVANVLQQAWSEGRDLDLGDLIAAIQKPPFEKLGVVDLETFYPAKERADLAMRLNGLLASPGFSAWLEGEALDIDRLLFRGDGRPRISIVSIAHLSDAERMFVVTLLLNELVSWMRSQSGTSSLRALLYMDEIFGFFPPTRNPPSKKPMLTLLKQARAYGVGCVLSTQNPVDLDYKGLSNCGSWFIGRLQTEQDKERVLDGLESAAGSAGTGLDRGRLSEIIGGLGKRVFLLHNVHEDGPELFQTRWVLSYLRGPLVRDQIAALMEGKKELIGRQEEAGDGSSGSRGIEAEVATPQSRRPVLGEGVEEIFVRPESEAREGERVLYRPRALADAQVHYRRVKYDVDLWRDVVVVTELGGRSIVWEDARILDGEPPSLLRRPVAGAVYADLPPVAQRPSAWSAAEKRLKTHLYRELELELFSHEQSGLHSEAGETEADFRRRVAQQIAEGRDTALEELREDFAADVESLQKRIQSAEERIDREESQHRDRKLQTAISFGTSLLGMVMGRKLTSASNRSGAARALRDLGRTRREGDDVERAQERLEDLLEEKAALEERFEDRVRELQDSIPSDGVELERVELPMLKTDLVVRRLVLAWMPWAVDADGIARPLSEIEG